MKPYQCLHCHQRFGRRRRGDDHIDALKYCSRRCAFAHKSERSARRLEIERLGRERKREITLTVGREVALLRRLRTHKCETCGFQWRGTRRGGCARCYGRAQSAKARPHLVVERTCPECGTSFRPRDGLIGKGRGSRRVFCSPRCAHYGGKAKGGVSFASMMTPTALLDPSQASGLNDLAIARYHIRRIRRSIDTTYKGKAETA